MQYAFRLDDTHWVRIPLRFPDGDDPDVFAWASRLATELDGGDAELRAAIVGRATELAAIEGPRGQAAERLWLLPTDRAPEAVAHLYFADAEGQPAEAFVLAGTDGGIQTVRELADGPFEDAVAAEVVLEADGGTLHLSRRIGRVEGTIALIEVIDAVPILAAAPDGPLDELLRGLVVQTG